MEVLLFDASNDKIPSLKKRLTKWLADITDKASIFAIEGNVITISYHERNGLYEIDPNESPYLFYLKKWDTFVVSQNLMLPDEKSIDFSNITLSLQTVSLFTSWILDRVQDIFLKYFLVNQYPFVYLSHNNNYLTFKEGDTVAYIPGMDRFILIRKTI